MTNFIFGIPLRSRVTAKDWGKVTGLLENTLASVLAQADDRFQIILACHEIPEIAALSDPRIKIVQAKFAPPDSDPTRQMQDKARKWRMIGAEARGLGGGYLMLVDADDLISKNIVGFVHRDADTNGYILKRGYEFADATGRVRWQPWFDQMCGTCAIFRFGPEDLPEDYDQITDRYFFRLQGQGHNKWEHLAQSNNRPLKRLPFPGAVYVIETGENWSGLRMGWRKRLIRHILPWRQPTETFRAEFAIPGR